MANNGNLSKFISRIDYNGIVKESLEVFLEISLCLFRWTRCRTVGKDRFPRRSSVGNGIELCACYLIFMDVFFFIAFFTTTCQHECKCTLLTE